MIEAKAWDKAHTEGLVQAKHYAAKLAVRFMWQGRYHQDIAVSRVLDAIAVGRDRILLTLATGTGKTFIAFQHVWKLFQSRWSLADWRGGTPPETPTRRPRVLFLADRNNLADQA